MQITLPFLLQSALKISILKMRTFSSFKSIQKKIIFISIRLFVMKLHAIKKSISIITSTRQCWIPLEFLMVEHFLFLRNCSTYTDTQLPHSHHLQLDKSYLEKVLRGITIVKVFFISIVEKILYRKKTIGRSDASQTFYMK